MVGHERYPGEPEWIRASAATLSDAEVASLRKRFDDAIGSRHHSQMVLSGEGESWHVIGTDDDDDYRWRQFVLASTTWAASLFAVSGSVMTADARGEIHPAAVTTWILAAIVLALGWAQALLTRG